MFKTNKNIILVYGSLLVIVCLSFILYKDSLGVNYFQDDWFSLKISNAKNFIDFLKFFIPRKDVIYYRPLGMQVPFFITQKMFSINPFPFRILTFANHAINIFLIFFLVRKLLSDESKALLAAFFYSISAVHYTVFYWSSTYAFMLGPTFFFASFLFFLKYFDKLNNNWLWLSFSVYILALLTNEMVISLPVILLIYLKLFSKKNYRSVLPFIFATVILLLIRFVYFRPPTFSDYQLNIGPETFRNLKAYLLWSFNWPEEIKAQFVSFFKINPLFRVEFADYLRVFISTLIINAAIVLLSLFIIFRVKKINDLLKLFSFAISWYIISLIPVLFFPNHSFSYYLSIPLVGLLIIFSQMLISLHKFFIGKFKKIYILLLILTVFSWYWASKTTVEFNSLIHFAPRRSKIARDLIEKGKKLKLPDNRSVIIYVSPSSENKLALNDQDALEVLYGREDITTAYYHVISPLYKL